MEAKRISELPGFIIAGGQPDIRGWSFHDPNGQKLGVIEDLTVDIEHLRVQEAIVDLHGHDYLLPIEALVLDRAGRCATGPWTEAQLREMPETKAWHSHEREVVRATYLPALSGAPVVGELSAEDVVALHAPNQGHDHGFEDEDPAMPGGVTIIEAEQVFIGEAPPLDAMDER